MAASMNTWVTVTCRRLSAFQRHRSCLWVLNHSCSERGCQSDRFFLTDSTLLSVRTGRTKLKKHTARTETIDHHEKEALTEFANPKQTLNTVLQLAGIVKPQTVLTYETKRVKNNNLSQTALHLKWPKPFTVVGHGRRKQDSQTAAAALACSHLKEAGVLNQDGLPGSNISRTDDAAIKKHLQKSSMPEYVQLPEDLKQRIQSLNRHGWQDPDEDPHLNYSDEFSFNAESEQETNTIADIITGRPYQECTEQQLNQRSRFLYDRWQQSRDLMNKAKLLAADLPIAAEREEILSVLENNRVAVLCGDTGCGKTTQVPQFILDSYLERQEGAKCNIVVTQPRRISAISVAERVTEERGEQVGDSIGYQVRLKSRLPQNNGCVLFCTTGILLKKLQSNPTLQGISHVIVDEVHERDMNTDFLLVLLKNALDSNPNLSLLLMSASINAEMFSQYFDGCPLIMVPGRMYPVKEYFLPEVLDKIGRAGHQRSLWGSTEEGEEYPETDHDLVVEVVRHLDREKPPGAILVFLPGWQDIKTVYDRLQEMWPASNRHQVYPVHSSIPLSEQQQIFLSPPDGCRKIVLATNIAETSITINDVVYVVNTGSHKEHRFKMNLGVSCLDLFWVSKANVKQRKGRAGRCQPGECYHLFTNETYQNMDDYEVPEILRVPLEQIVVMSKIHGPDLPAVDFLSQALQPPAAEAVERAVEELQELGILNENESLTSLGEKISHISTEPRLAKALVMSAIFRCVNPVLTITARLGSREPFRDSIDNRQIIQKIKNGFADNSYSDHLLSANLFRRWFDSGAEGRWAADEFNQSFMIHRPTMFFIKGLRQQFSDNLEEAGLVVSGRDCLLQYDSSSDFADDELIKGVLLGAFFPNVIKASLGKFKKGKLHTKKLSFKDHNSHRLLLSRRSVNGAVKAFPSRWFTYFSKMQSGEIFVHDTSMVHPLALICFSNQPVSYKVPSPKEVEEVSELFRDSIEGDWSQIVRMSVTDASLSHIGSFYATEETADALMTLRAELQEMIQDVLALESKSDMPPSMYDRHTALLEILVDVLNTKQALFMSPSTEKSRTGNTTALNIDVGL